MTLISNINKMPYVYYSKNLLMYIFISNNVVDSLKIIQFVKLFNSITILVMKTRKIINYYDSCSISYQGCGFLA